MQKLVNNYENTLTKCQKREIIYAGHYVFGYMAKKYNLNYISAYGISPDSEVSAKDLVDLIKQIQKHQVKYIFAEEMLDQKTAQTLTKETNTQILLLNPAETLSKTDFENQTSFVKIMEDNLDNLQIGLQCN